MDRLRWLLRSSWSRRSDPAESPRAARRRRWYRAARRTLAAVVAVYLAILMFPEMLFAHHLHHRNFHVYSETAIDPAIIPILDRAAALMARSALDDTAMEHRLFLCDGPLKRRFLTPMTRGAFGATYSGLLGRNTILGRTDVAANRVFRDATLNNRRPLDAVIAHERIHALMGSHYGDLACLLMPTWKKEGYCEYIAGSPSFGIEEGKRLLREGRDDPSGPFRYFQYTMMVKYLMDIEKLDLDEVVAREFDPAELLARMRPHVDRL